MTERYVTNLTDAQADGLACVVCRRDYLTCPAGTRRVPVGRSITGSQVFACVGECARRFERPAVTR